MDMSLEEIEKLKRMLEEKEKEKLDEFQGKKVLGFSLSKCTMNAKNGKQYIVWRAHACKKGKKAIVHIGKDPRKAKEKVKKYLKDHPAFAIEQETR